MFYLADHALRGVISDETVSFAIPVPLGVDFAVHCEAASESMPLSVIHHELLHVPSVAHVQPIDRPLVCVFGHEAGTCPVVAPNVLSDACHHFQVSHVHIPQLSQVFGRLLTHVRERHRAAMDSERGGLLGIHESD